MNDNYLKTNNFYSNNKLHGPGMEIAVYDRRR